MEQKIWHNGELIPYEEATIHVLSHVVHYGSSVFEGLRCYDTKRGPAVFRLEAHMQRLIDSASIYRMEVPYSLDALQEGALKTVAQNKLRSCYIRPVVFRGQGPMGVNPLENPIETYLAAWEWGAYLGEEALNQGVDVQVASWSRMAPNTTPALSKAGGNYLNASLVKMDATLNGYTEGIMLNQDGYVAEGSGENVFIVRDGTLHTAPSSLSILPGITRDAVITLARERGYTIKEERIPREALYLADEVFFTGTAAEITPIRSIDKHTIGEGERGPVTKELQDAFFEVVQDGKDPHNWLTIVEMEESVPA